VRANRLERAREWADRILIAVEPNRRVRRHSSVGLAIGHALDALSSLLRDERLSAPRRDLGECDSAGSDDAIRGTTYAYGCEKVTTRNRHDACLMGLARRYVAPLRCATVPSGAPYGRVVGPQSNQ